MNHTPPTLAQVIELRVRAPDSLESAAASINRHIDLFTRAAGTFQAHRIRAGFELIAVRKRIPHGEWEDWCADNIHRSMRDIQRLMKMAGADDPEETLEKERAAGRKSMATTRAKATNVCRIPTSDLSNFHIEPAQAPGRACVTVKQVFQSFLKLNADERAEFMALVEKEMGNETDTMGEQKLSEDAKFVAS